MVETWRKAADFGVFMEKLNAFLQKSYTAFHAVENAKALLDEQGFTLLPETDDWALEEGGKYYVTRDGAVIAFTVGSLSDFSYKIVASHTDSPALKLKENPVQKSAFYATLNVETYGGGLWYSLCKSFGRLAGFPGRSSGLCGDFRGSDVFCWSEQGRKEHD